MIKFISLILLSFCVAQCHAQSTADMVRKGLALDSAGLFEKAIVQFTSALNVEPSNPVILYNRANSRMKLGQYTLAVVDFNRVIYLDTSFLDAYYNRSIAYHYTNNLQFAIADLEHYISRAEPYIDLYLERANLYMEMKDYKGAIESYELVHNTHPENGDIAMTLFQVCMLSGDFTKAEATIQEMILMYPDSLDFYLHRAELMFQLGKYDQSLNDVQLYSLKDQANVQALKLKADIYFYQSRHQDASEIYEKILNNDSGNCNLLADLGHCMLQLGNYSKADSFLTASIRGKNNAPAYAYLGRGIARYNLGNGDGACEDWNKSYKLGEEGALQYLKENCKLSN